MQSSTESCRFWNIYLGSFPASSHKDISNFKQPGYYPSAEKTICSGLPLPKKTSWPIFDEVWHLKSKIYSIFSRKLDENRPCLMRIGLKLVIFPLFKVASGDGAGCAKTSSLCTSDSGPHTSCTNVTMWSCDGWWMKVLGWLGSWFWFWKLRLLCNPAAKKRKRPPTRVASK